MLNLDVKSKVTSSSQLDYPFDDHVIVVEGGVTGSSQEEIPARQANVTVVS